MAIRCITFDWGDTLTANHGMPRAYITRRALADLADALRALGGEPSATWAEDRFAELATVAGASVDPERNPEHREIDMDGILAGWATDVGVTPAVAAEAIADFGVAITESVIPFAGVHEALDDLRAHGYRLGILSHVPWPGAACHAWFRRWGLADRFDFYSLSCEIGWIKPNPIHYHHAVAQAGCAPGEILHVGDHPERDIAGARACGLRTCLRMTERIYPEEALAACRPDAVIVRLRELPAIAAQLGQDRAGTRSNQ